MKTIEELVAEVAKNLGTAKRQDETRSEKKTGTAAAKKPAAPPKPMAVTNAAVSEPDTYKKMTLSIAKEAARAAETAAKITGVNIVVAVCDEGANLVLLHAMDDSYIASINAARDKAYTAVALKMPTHTALKESRGGALDGLTNGNGILLLGGGFPLISGNKIYGGIGVSGGTKEQDTLIASVAAEALRIAVRKGGAQFNGR